MKMMRVTVGIGVLGLLLGSMGMQAEQAEPNTLTAAERADGWTLLFDGETTAGWRGYNADSMPDGWQAVDGALARVGQGGDIITEDQFENFELYLEWKLEVGGNSGVFFCATEDAEEVFHTAPEMQVLDDGTHPDGKSMMTSAGSDYALYGRSRDTVKPIGEWNAVRIIADGSHVEYWLNGVRVVEYELWTADWEARVAASKFSAYPQFGRARSGHFAIQDHGDPVYFRNIKVRELPSSRSAAGEQ